MTLAIVAIVSISFVVLLGLSRVGKRSELEQKIFELKAEKYNLEKRNAKLQADFMNLKASWRNMKSNLPNTVPAEMCQDKSGESSSC